MTDFTVTITDQAMLDAINWAMARDNAYPGRATPIASAQDYVQIEVLALFSQVPAQKQQSDIAAAVAAAQALRWSPSRRRGAPSWTRGTPCPAARGSAGRAP